MERRRALLICIPEYDEPAFHPLPAVRNDVAELEEVLRRSHYEVQTRGTDDRDEVGLNRLRRAIADFFEAAEAGDTLLLYFSCHGLYLEARGDYIVPADASAKALDLHEYLLKLEFSHLLEASAAATLLVVVDACREGIEIHPGNPSKGPRLGSFGSAKREQVSERRLAYYFGCAKAEYCRCVGEEFSLFSRAFAAALDPHHSAQTLRELAKATDLILRQLAKEHGLKPQATWLDRRSSVADDIDDVVFCEGAVAAGELSAADPWARRVENSALWISSNPGTATDTSRLLAAEVARRSRQYWLAGRQELAADPWADEAFALRVVGRLELLKQYLPQLELSAAETCLLTAMPFFYQALIAAGMALAAREGQVFNVKPQSERSPLRVDLEKVHQSFPAWIRLEQRLRELGRVAAADAIAAWCLHLCLRRRPQTFLPEERDGSLPATFLAEIRQEAGKAGILWSDTFESDDLFELAHCLSADIEFPGRKLEEERQVGTDAERGPLRIQLLGTLLLLAGTLAVEPASLDGVLVSHLGSSDPLDPAEILETLGKAQWNRHGKERLSLQATCRHPALDQALRLYVEELGKRGAFLNRAIEVEERKALKPLLGLPWLFDSDGLKAEKDAEGNPRYTTPHLRFHLAQDEVRELLLGERIYDDPSLAIRELYQNALDACRYRQAREEYLKRTGRGGNLAPWEGSIVFRQWTEEDGREIIECEDNGVGMGRRELETCFARAGRRFADTPEYLEEEAEWHKLDPPLLLYPNSQFGIGVFSYFLLADEIEVFTRRFEKDGRPGQALHVQLSGSGSLFRIRELRDEGQACGCRVRLTLTKKEISCLEALRERLWRAEFPTKVWTEEEEELWLPGELKIPSDFEAAPVATQHPDVFWLTNPEYFAILADGVLVQAGRSEYDFDVWAIRLNSGLVDLRGVNRPKLALNRNALIGEKSSLTWALEVLENSGEVVGASTNLEVDWLWDVSFRQARVSAFLAKWAYENKVPLRLRGDKMQPAIRLNEVGFFPLGRRFNVGRFSLENLQNIPRSWLWSYLGALGSSGVAIPDVFAHWLELNPPEVWQAPDPVVSTYLSFRNLSMSSLALMDLLAGATWTGLSVSEFVRSLPEPLGQRAEALIGKCSASSLDRIPVSIEELALFSRNFIKRAPWLSGRVGFGHLLNASEHFQLPIETVLNRLRDWEELLELELPPAIPCLPEALDKKLLQVPPAYRRYSAIRWLNAGRVSMPVLWEIAARLKMDILKVFARLQAWAEPFGLELPPAEKVEKFSRPPEGLDAGVLRDSYGDWVDSAGLTLFFVWQKSSELKEKPRVVVEIIRPWADALDLVVPEMPEDLPEPDGRDRRLLTQNLDPDDDYYPHGLERGPLDPLHVLCAAVEFDEPVSKILARLEPYKEAFGLEIPAELYELP